MIHALIYILLASSAVFLLVVSTVILGYFVSRVVTLSLTLYYTVRGNWSSRYYVGKHRQVKDQIQDYTDMNEDLW